MEDSDQPLTQWGPSDIEYLKLTPEAAGQQLPEAPQDSEDFPPDTTTVEVCSWITVLHTTIRLSFLKFEQDFYVVLLSFAEAASSGAVPSCFEGRGHPQQLDIHTQLVFLILKIQLCNQKGA